MEAIKQALPLLDGMPRIFSLSDLKQAISEQESALDVALRWLEAGVIRQVAPARPIFYRVVLGEPLTDAERCAALLRTFPSVVMVAGSSLWRQGVSVQKDAQLECCITEQQVDCSLPGVMLRYRPSEWWTVIRQAEGVVGNYHGVAMLTPEMAVADAAAFKDVWMPDRNGIDWTRLSTARLSVATEALAPLRMEELAE